VDEQIAGLLKVNPYLKSHEVARRVGKSESTVRRSDAWIEHRARIAGSRKAKKIRTRILKRSILANVPGKDEDPAVLAAESEVIERHYLADVDPETSEDDESRYLDAASPEQLAEYHQMSPEDQEHTVKTWRLYGV
jgi:hypothetical protein